MKTSKKLLAFLLSAIMVLSLVVSVSVVASAEAAEDYFYFNDFDAEPSTKDPHIMNFSKDNFARSHDAEKGEWTFKANVVTTSSTRRLFNIEGLTYQKGHSYDIIVGAKGVPATGSTADVQLRAMSPLSSSGSTVVIKNAAGDKHSYTGGSYVSLNAETVTEAKLTYMVYDIQKTVDGVTTSQDSTTLTFGVENNAGNVIGDTYVIDYVKIIDNAPRTGATFTIDNGITVTAGGQTIVSGTGAQESYYGEGLPTSFEATIPAGKSARIIVDGNKLTAGSGTLAFTVPVDAKTVKVELVDNKIVYANYFNNASTDKNFVSPNGFSASKITASSSPNKGENYLQYEVKDGVLRAYFIEKSSTTPKYGGTRLFNMKFGDAKFEGGHKYQINLKYKTSESYGLQMQQGSVWMEAESTNNYYKGSKVTTSTDYSTYSYTFDFYGRGTNKYKQADLSACYFYESQDVSATMGLYANITSGYDGDEEIIIDEVELIDLGKSLNTVTLDVASEGGSFKRFYQYSTSKTDQGYVPVNSTTAYGKAGGKDLKFEIIPEEGKVALIKYYDEVKIIKVGDDYNFAFKADKGDTTLSVKFIDPEATAEIANTEILFRNGAVYVYGLISDFVKGEGLNYGVRLWNTADEETVWKLEACADANQTLAVAKSGQAFAIKAYGDLISEDNTYAAKAYVGDVEGETVTTAAAE